MEEAERRRLASSRFEVVRVDEAEPVQKRSLVDIIHAANNETPLETRQPAVNSPVTTPTITITDEADFTTSRTNSYNGIDSESTVLIPGEEPFVVLQQKKTSNTWKKQCLCVTVFFVILVIGITLVEILHVHREMPLQAMNFLYVFRAIGIYGFSGGIITWISIRLVFHRIPGFIGSGSIPSQYKEIKQTLRSTIIQVFFDQEFLTQYLEVKEDDIAAAINLGERRQAAMNSEDISLLIDKQIHILLAGSDGAALRMAGMDGTKLKAILQSCFERLANNMNPQSSENSICCDLINAASIQREVDAMIVTKLKDVSAKQVTKMVQDLIYDPLGMIVVWASILGGIIGLTTELLLTL